jgi:hypothetical protein
LNDTPVYDHNTLTSIKSVKTQLHVYALFLCETPVASLGHAMR